MDKLLNAAKDFEGIERYLEAINQTTDDFLYMFDIPNNRLRIFGPIESVSTPSDSPRKARSIEEILPIVHPADRGILSADVEQLRQGEKDSHNINFRIFNLRGETVWVNSRGKVLHDENGAPHVMIGRLSEEALRHLFNPLTGLWNKTKLREDLQSRLPAGRGWLMLLGIPSLASINLSHGRDFGNQLLSEMADLLEKIDCIEESYHIDNNDFAVILRECETEAVEEVYGQIFREMEDKCSVFAGVVPVDTGVFRSVSQLIDSANLTLQDAQQNPASPLAFFSPDEIRARLREFSLLEELKESVQDEFSGFEVYYQPQIKRGDYTLYGVEALLRYNSKERGRVFPDAFIPILEHSGLIEPVGLWVLEKALAQCKEWRKNIPDLQVAVNFSSVQFEDEQLGEKIIDALKKAGLPGNALTVELTESVRLGENKHFYQLIRYLESYGIRFAIDDSGTGYSTRGYLKQMDVSEIKIDRSFVTEIEKDTYNYHLVSNVIDFAKTNAIHTCCEGVETPHELSILETLQPDFFQGYLFDKPCTVTEIEEKYIHTSSNAYKTRLLAIDEIHRFQEQFGSIHFDPKNILHENNVGLWILHIDEKNNRYELHTDEVMERVLGLEEKLSPAEAFSYWRSRIPENVRDTVSSAFQKMVAGGKAVQLEYRWQHPAFGEVLVRSSGVRSGNENDRIVLEGYHRILTGIVDEN